MVVPSGTAKRKRVKEERYTIEVLNIIKYQPCKIHHDNANKAYER